MIKKPNVIEKWQKRNNKAECMEFYEPKRCGKRIR